MNWLVIGDYCHNSDSKFEYPHTSIFRSKPTQVYAKIKWYDGNIKLNGRARFARLSRFPLPANKIENLRITFVKIEKGFQSVYHTPKKGWARFARLPPSPQTKTKI